MVREAKLQRTEHGLVPEGQGWFVLNARESRWVENADFGRACFFQGDVPFPAFGFNLNVLEPGQPLCMYHGEDEQEGFLMLAGEALLLIEGEERPLRPWDYVHCPAWTEHVIVGAGSGLCVVLAVGTRTKGGVVYPAAEVALKHDAGVREETRDPKEAYAESADDTEVSYRDGDLPDC